jgi:hypothetical protein
MGASDELRAMADRKELERIEANLDKADTMLVAASRSLTTARSIVSSDPDSALILAWDAIAFQALAATLAIAGYRVTSQAGHHRTAVEASRLLLPDDALLSRIGRLMRFRAEACTKPNQLRKMR